MNSFKDQVLEQFQIIFSDIIKTLPTVIQFIFFVLLSWVILKIVLFVIKNILVKSKIDKLSDRLSQTNFFGDLTIKVKLSKVIIGIVKWFLILFLLLAGANIFKINTISDVIKALFTYLPRLVTALVIFSGGVYLGTLIKNAIAKMFKSMDISGGNLIGRILFYLIVIFTSITALDLTGVDTSIIKQNITLILGSLLLAFTISFGLGSRDVVTRLLFGYYSRKNIQIGTKIRFKGFEGEVLAIDNICLTLGTEKGKVIFPIKDIVEDKVELL